MKKHYQTIARSNPSKIKAYLMRFDFLQFFAVLFLICNGLVFIYSTSFENQLVDSGDFFFKQIFWIIISLPFYFVISNFDYRYLRIIAYPGYFFNIFLLILVLFVGLEINGAKRWLDLGFFNLQVSELMKVFYLLTLSAFLSQRNFDINRAINIIAVAFMTILPFGLIFIEPDLGSALTLLPIGFSLVFISGLKKRLITIFTIIAVVMITLLTLNEVYKVKPILKQYHRSRIMAFINPEQAPSDMTYQQRQSIIAVGSGGLDGKGIGNGTQHTLGFLPRTASNNDFIFSVIAEEGGFMLGSLVILVYLLLCGRIFFVGLLCKDQFGRYLAVGIGVYLFTHVFVNIGVNIGLAPVTGLPLPFISYGGSFMISTLTILGISQSISYMNKLEKE